MMHERVDAGASNSRSSGLGVLLSSFQRILNMSRVKELLERTRVVLLLNFPRLTTSTATQLSNS